MERCVEDWGSLTLVSDNCPEAPHQPLGLDRDHCQGRDAGDSCLPVALLV